MKLGSDLAGRGVYVAPWVGPAGEFVLLAITRDRKLACPPHVIPLGGNHVAAGDAVPTLHRRPRRDCRRAG